jgi:recombination protein U
MHYPKGSISSKKSVFYGNRGMDLENDLNDSNTFYRIQNKAVIYKKPTPITISKVDYPSRVEAVIREAYFKTPSTTDYNGIYKGKYIDFEAKETKLEYFPLANIHIHQIEHLKMIINHGGIGFLIIRFIKYNKTFLLEGRHFFEFLENEKRKSIPFSYFEEKGHIIKEKYQPRLDYLEIVDNIFFKGDIL